MVAGGPGLVKIYRTAAQVWLDDESEWVRRNAAEAIGFIGQGEAAVPGLVGQLENDPWPCARHNAALALGRLDTTAPEVIEALRRAQEDENYYTSRVAGSVLNRLDNGRDMLA